jgi:RND family efflux transporter MFP subunit
MNLRMREKPANAAGKLALLLPLLFALGACGGNPAPVAQTHQTVSGLSVETVRLQTIPNRIAAPGTVESLETAQLAAQVMGTVDRVTVHEGDRVRRGQLLVVLDDRQLAAQRDAAQAGLAQAVAAREEAARATAAAKAQAGVAEKTYKRYIYLREQKSVSPQEFDEVEAKQQAAQAMLAAARARQQQAAAGYQQAAEQLRAANAVASYARIVAPFDGVVQQRFVDPGAMASPGMPLLTVEGTAAFRLVVTVDAENAAGIRVGSAVPVVLDVMRGRTLTGHVTEIEPGANPASHTLQVKIDLPRDPALRSGLFGRAWFTQGTRQAIVIPQSAILDRGQLRGVYVVDASGVIHFRLVTLGAQAAGEEGRIALSGLGPGERVVTDPGARDLDGKKLEAGH